MNGITSKKRRGKSRAGISFERFSSSSRADFRFAPLEASQFNEDARFQ